MKSLLFPTRWNYQIRKENSNGDNAAIFNKIDGGWSGEESRISPLTLARIRLCRSERIGNPFVSLFEKE
jgi:hypothetical protein